MSRRRRKTRLALPLVWGQLITVSSPDPDLQLQNRWLPLPYTDGRWWFVLVVLVVITIPYYMSYHCQARHGMTADR